MDEKTLWEIVDASVVKVDQPYYILSGSFLSQFAFVEMKLTAILCDLTGLRDLETFHVLTKGMDARVKIERLRKLAKLHDSDIGPVLTERLKFFEEKIIPTRNDLAHGAIWINQADQGKWHVITIDTFQVASFEDDGLDAAPKFYTAGDLAAKAKWCNLFQDELGQVLLREDKTIPLEITHPKMQAPKDTQKGPRQPAGPAKSRKPPQERP